MSRVIIVLGFLVGFSALAEHSGGGGGRSEADAALQQQIDAVAAACGVDARNILDPVLSGAGSESDPSTGGVDLGGGDETLPPLPPTASNDGDAGGGKPGATGTGAFAKCISCHTSGDGAKKRKFASKEEIKSANAPKSKIDAMITKAGLNDAEKKEILAFLGHDKAK